MSISEIKQKVTSFANMHLNASRIRTIESETGAEYIGALVVETLPNGSTQDAMILKIEWCPTCGLNGDWMIFIAYTNPQAYVPSAWVSKSVLTLKGE